VGTRIASRTLYTCASPAYLAERVVVCVANWEVEPRFSNVVPYLAALAAGGGLAFTPRLAAAMEQAERLASPWQPLFNGRNLDGWRIFEQEEANADPPGAIVIERNELRTLDASFKGPDKAAYGHIATLDDHDNYHFRMEFRFGSCRFSPRTLQRRNIGLLYHIALHRDRLFPDCVEFQYEEGDTGDAIMVNTTALLGP
jgi:hypothetical protein